MGYNTYMASREKMEMTHIQREQLDRQFETLRDNLPRQPKKGWIHEIRTALMMTSAQLGKRMGLVQSSIISLEKSEQADTISLKSLKRAAEALECELHYVLVPKTTLQSTLFDRAEKIYKEEMARLNHQMILESQESPQDTTRRIYDILSLYDKVWDRET
jgi:predicted DNA-binding mobile mystery protein A